MNKEKFKHAFSLFKQDCRKLVPAFIFLLIALFLLWQLVGTACYFKALFGIPCPFCGMTRATIFMLEGNFVATWQMQPLAFLFYGGFLFVLYERYFENLKFEKSKNILLGIAIAFFLFYTYRMATIYPEKPPMKYHEKNLLKYLNNQIQK